MSSEFSSSSISAQEAKVEIDREPAEQAPKKSGGGQRVMLIVGCLLSALLLAGLFWSMNWAQLRLSMSRIELIWMPLFFVALIGTLWIRAIRWRILLPNGNDISRRVLFDSVTVGQFANAILPLRAGEFIRPLMLARTSSVSFMAGFASIVTERIFDIVTLLLLLGVSFAQLPNVPAFVNIGAQALAAVAVVTMLIVVMAYFRGDMLLAFADKVLRGVLPKGMQSLIPRLMGLAGEFVAGLRVLRSVDQVVLALFWSLVLWLTNAVLFQIGIWMMGETQTLWAGIVTTVLVAFAVAAPSAPGFLGTFQFGCVAALSGVFGMPEEFAMAFSLVLHATQTIITVALGIWVLKRAGLSLRELKVSAPPKPGQT